MKYKQFLRIFMIALSAAVFGAASLSYAQETDANNIGNLTFGEAPTGEGQSTGTSSSTAAAPDDGWHFVVAPYLWLTGVHGTAGTPTRELSIHASAGDLLSHFRFGLMGLVEADHKRIVLPLDIIWARLGDNQALPFPNLPATTAEFKASEFILTPKVGYRLLDQKKIKIDAPVSYTHLTLPTTPYV